MYIPYNKTKTSKAAARKAKGLAKGHAKEIYSVLVKSGENGATAQELSEITGIVGDSIRPRLIHLEKEGFVKRSGKTRKTKSGRDAEVWIAARN